MVIQALIGEVRMSSPLSTVAVIAIGAPTTVADKLG